MSSSSWEPTEGQRRWRGQEPADRTAARRRQLLEAGTELMGTAGVVGMSMRAVCREAGLTERYFYESFPNLETLQVAVLDEVVLGARDRLLQSFATAPPKRREIFAHVVTHFTDYVLTDPRRGRIMFIQSQATVTLSARGNELITEFTAPMAMSMAGGDKTRNPADDIDIRLNASAIFSALAFLYRPWLDDSLTGVSLERFNRHAASVIIEIARVRSAL
ncbi:TetR/AcrR family transcriptional regulator [Nocardia alni]|uniref:TetR/AcrR family transcriptional regulator n=1 Tax=Nocardia alni TaxID=2815723 RepID=UPI001C2437C4|nr:TetR/AcrR family transcriptional regulator [Nocardia alni]